MKTLQKNNYLILTFSLILIGLNTHICVAKIINGEKEESIELLFGALEKAVNARQFSNAKEAINKMLPLMKKDIRENKKMLSSWNKNQNTTSLNKNTFASNLIIKNKIYDSTKGLVNSSPAAIRVKGKKIVEMIDTYIGLKEN